MQPSEIYRYGDDLGLVAAHLAQAAGGPGDVAATGVSNDDRVGLASVALLHLTADLDAESFDAGDAVGGVKAGVEVSGVGCAAARRKVPVQLSA